MQSQHMFNDCIARAAEGIMRRPYSCVVSLSPSHCLGGALIPTRLVQFGEEKKFFQESGTSNRGAGILRFERRRQGTADEGLRSPQGMDVG